MIYTTVQKATDNRVIESLNAVILPLTFKRESNILEGYLYRDMSQNICKVVGSDKYKPVNATFIKKILVANW